MMLLAQAVMPGKIAVATVNHGLRREAEAETRYVAELCEERGIDCAILTPETPITGNIQSAARAARYGLLHGWAEQSGCDKIATAHHADDQLETILMRLARGSGVDGLSGVRPQNGAIIRPLLGFTKAELVSICEDAGLASISDPSNDNADFDRVRIRQWLAATDHPLSALSAAISASALAEASDALDWSARRLAPLHIRADGTDICFDPANLPPELLRRLLLMALRHIIPDYRPRGPSLTRLIDSLQRGETAMIGDILCIPGDIWRLRSAPPRSKQK